MNRVFRLQGTEFEWNVDKAKSNLRKHGVSFEEAAEAFFDPFYQEGYAFGNDETRDFILGYSVSQKLLLIIFVERGERIRLISARPATRHERRLYEEA